MTAPSTNAIQSDPLVLPTGTPARDAIRALYQAASCCALAVDAEQCLVGIFTEWDIVRAVATDQPLEALTLADAMTAPAIAVSEPESRDLAGCLARLQQHHIQHLPVVDAAQQPVGLITADSLLVALNSAAAIETQHELARSRDLLAAVFNDSTDALFLVSAKTLLIVDCNPRAVELFECADKAALIGRSGLTLHKRPLTPEEIASSAAAVDTQGYWSCDVEYVTAQGREFWGNLSAKPIQVAGQALHLVRVTEINARKQAEAHLRRYERIVSATPDGICLIGHDYRYQIVNQTYRDWHQRDNSQLVGQTVSAVLGSELFETVVRAKLDRALAGETCRYADWFDFADSRRRYLSVAYAPYREEAGEIVGVVVNLRDVTERQRTEVLLRGQEVELQARNQQLQAANAALDEQKSLLEKILDALPAFIFLKEYRDERVTFRFLNRATIEAFGLQGRDFGSLNYGEMFGDQAEAFHAGDRTVLDCNQAHTIETPFQALDGETYHIILSRTPILVGPDAGDRWLVACAIDITERYRAAQALQTAKAAAEAAARAKSAFIANISHEWRSPLNAILGFTDLLLHNRNLLPDQQENLRTIHRSGEHLLHLINQILTLVRAEAERLELVERDFNLAIILREVEAMFYLETEAKGLNLCLHWSSAIPHGWYGDDVKLRQVLINLLSNAIKFTDVGEIVVSVSARPVAHGRHQLEFAIRDTGSGIAAEVWPRLFEPFNHTNRRPQSGTGSGLGLAISRHCARLMGGDITAESHIDQGSTFRFTCQLALSPIDALSDSTLEPRPRRLAVGQPSYRILVVDDDAVNQRLLVQLLAPLGFEVRAVGDGQAAIARWQRWQPHLIWLDLQMPGLDGYATASQIRQREAALADSHPPRVTLVALSATADPDSQQRARAAGCDAFCNKPLQAKTIFATLQRHLELQYEYDAELPELEPTATLRPEQLQVIPANERANLVTALVRCEPAAIQVAIAAIARHQPETAATVQHFANNLRYEQLLQLLEAS